VTHALVSRRHIDAWEWLAPAPPADGEGAAEGTHITVTNPLSADHSLLRQTLVGGLLDTVALNRRRGIGDLALFEVGKGYGRVADATHEWWRLGIALAGAFDVTAWNRQRRPADVDDVKGLLELLCSLLGLSAPRYEALTSEPTLHPGRAARVEARDTDGTLAISGVVGEVHPAAAAAWDERTVGTVIAELSVRGLSEGALPVPRGVAPARHPSVERDIAIVVAGGGSAGAMEAAIRASVGELLRGVALFDVYRGAPLLGDERSLAYRLTFASPDRTLTEAEVESAMADVTAAVTRVGGRIRT
jgi:phenylalanyl-tRNA synthetase beta chain